MNDTQTNPTTYQTQTLFFSSRYPDARAAIAWLEKAFGATKFVSYDAPDGSVQHAEMHLLGNTFMLGTRRGEEPTDNTYVVLPDAAAVDALCERARAAGATITHEPYDQDYGSHDFRALDIGGNAWSFGTYRCGVPNSVAHPS